LSYLISKGYFFGEIDLLFSETRKYSYRAQTDGQLLVINKNDFTKMFFQEFPDIGAEIYNNALKRRVRQNTSYKEALSYCQTRAKEKERKIENYRPQLSNLSREKLKIRGKDLLENFMKRSLNQQAEEKEEQEQKEHPIKEEKSESPKKFTLKNIIKFGRGNAEENKDLEKMEKDQGDKSVKNVTEQKLGVSWREDMKEENKGKELLDKEKIEAKEAPKSRGWSLIRKKVKDMKKEARERMAGKKETAIFLNFFSEFKAEHENWTRQFI